MRLAFLLLISITTLCYAKHLKKPWTVFIYMAADNDLNKFAEPNIQQMMQAGSNDARTILVYLAETKNQQKYGKLLRIEKNELIEITHEPHADSGAQKTCLNACIRAFTEYPADHYALIFWDHGSGCLNMPYSELFRSIAYDEPFDTYLSDNDIITILQQISQIILHGKKIDILGFDACLMASIELQALCAPYIHYYVASEETEQGPGWNYTTSLHAITHDSSPKEIAQAWVKAYDQTYSSSTHQYTLSAVDLSTISFLANNIDAVAQNLIFLLKHQQDQRISAVLQKATTPSSITCFEDYQKPDYVDLDHLYANILEHLQLYYTTDTQIQKLINDTQELLIKGRELIRKVVIANAVSKQHARASGISIYWTQEIVHPSYNTLVWTQVHPNWEKLLHTYLDTRNVEVKL